MTKQEIELKYGVPSIRNWSDILPHLHTKTSALREKIVIPSDAKPDAVKNASSVTSSRRDRIYFLYDIRKYKKEK